MQHFYIEHWLFIFSVYCIIGWVQESVIESIYHKKPMNRGFLRGPYIPIYGFGGILLLFICMPFKNNGFLVFIVAMLGCTLLEYFTGWLLETIFGKQFWDYSMLKLTYKNRVSLVSSLFWGTLGLFVTYILSDITYKVVLALPHTFVCAAAIIVLSLMTLDFFNTVKKQINHEKIEKTFNFVNISSQINIVNRIKRRSYSDYYDDNTHRSEEKTSDTEK